MKTKIYIVLLLIISGILTASAQKKIISGTVNDPTGVPLIGLKIAVKGTSQSTTTDFDGNYTLEASEGDVLTFSYLGFKTTEMVIDSDNTSINVTMEQDPDDMQDMVVEAYRTTTKATSNISTVSITSETIESRPSTSFAQTLQGQVAGLNITNSGSNSSVHLRGIGSLSGNTEPLFVIDGISVNQDAIQNLNPGEIASISVLKDAGATAIYGNRGANGAVVIKTRRASYNTAFKINYTAINGFSSIRDHNYNLMSSREQLLLESIYGKGYGASELVDSQDFAIAQQTNTDWAAVFFGNGTTKNHTLTLTSGGEHISTFTSFGYFEEKGVLSKVKNAKRFSLRNNLNGKFKNDKFNYTSSISINYSQSNLPTGVAAAKNLRRDFVFDAYYSVPYITTETDTNFNDISLLVINPKNALDFRNTYTNREDEIKILANVSAGYKVTKDITFRSSLGLDFTNVNFLEVIDTEFPFIFQYSDQSELKTLTINFNNAVTYKKTIANTHHIEASFTTEYFKAHLRSFGFRQNGFNYQAFFPGDGSGFINDNSTNDEFVDYPRARIRNAGLFSYFVFADYDYNQTYGISATVRRDASYRFSDSNKWGTFYSVTGRLNMHKLHFMEGSVFDVLKLKASYGTTGNQRIIDAPGQLAYFSGSGLTENGFILSSNYESFSGITVGHLGNKDLKWETIIQTNIGIDFELFNRRLSGSMDLYKKTTKDLFLSRNISPASNGGISVIRGNLGELQNTGVDATLRYNIVKGNNTGGPDIALNFSGSYNKQKIVDLGEAGTQSSGLTQNRVGGPINEFFLIRYAGVNPSNGHLLFYDRDGYKTENPTNADRVNTGKNSFPDYQGSFGFDAKYKNFSLTAQCNYVIGVDRLDVDLARFQNPANIGNFRNSRALIRSWTPNNILTDIPSLTAKNLYVTNNSDRYLRSADYVRLRFLQLGYNFSKKRLKAIGISSLKIFANAENLLTLSKWKGFNVEAAPYIGLTQFPEVKTFSIGLEAGF